MKRYLPLAIRDSREIFVDAIIERQLVLFCLLRIAAEVNCFVTDATQNEVSVEAALLCKRSAQPNALWKTILPSLASSTEQSDAESRLEPRYCSTCWDRWDKRREFMLTGISNFSASGPRYCVLIN